MTKYVATFSGAKYFETTKRIVEGAPKFGADRVLVVDDWWLRNCRPGFWEKTKYFRERADVRGVDYFCFKPFYILEMFRRLGDGDILLALDADTYPIADLNPLYERCKRDGGKLLFNVLGCFNRWYTKKDVFLLMGCDEPKYYDTFQAVARFILLEKGGEFPAEKFLLEWLAFTANPLINTFDPSVLAPDQPELIQSRCEQSVLTNLSVKYGCRLYREACQNGNGGLEDWDVFPQTFEQVGPHSYRLGYYGDESEGSVYRNVKD